jgi:hypothetical protein
MLDRSKWSGSAKDGSKLYVQYDAVSFYCKYGEGMDGRT